MASTNTACKQRTVASAGSHKSESTGIDSVLRPVLSYDCVLKMANGKAAVTQQPIGSAVSHISEGMGSFFQKSSGLEHFTVSQTQQTIWERNIPLLKLIALTGLPLIALVLIAFASLLEAHRGVEHVEHMDNIVSEVDHIRGVIGALQKERSATCLFLNIDNSSSLGQMLLEEYREKTDEALSAHFDIHNDLAAFSAEVEEIIEDLQKHIHHYRNNLPNTCSEVLIFYDGEVELLIAKMNSLSRVDSDGHFWIDLFARNLIWHIKENIGTKQAIGSSFFAKGYLSKEDKKRFAASSSMADSLLEIVFTKSPDIKNHWRQLAKEERELSEKMERMEMIISSGDGKDKMSQSSTLDWFSVMNKFLNVIRILEHDLTVELARDVKSQRDVYSKHFWTVLCGIVAVVMFCSSLTLLHGFQSHKLTLKIRKYTIRMAEKNAKIESERRKSEQLLAQMMPVSITKRLLAGKNVDPETYEEATVFFSDVKDFTETCGRCSPLEVVNLLNELYMMFDGILDSYDCYKVETVGDGYMVVSGVPEKNGHQHSNEICTMALEIMKSTTKPGSSSQSHALAEFTATQSKQTKRQRAIPLMKIFVLIGFPMMAFIGIAIGSLMEAHWGVEHADQMATVGNDVNHIRKVVATIQGERAASCLYLGNHNSSNYNQSTFKEYCQQTDAALSAYYNMVDSSKNSVDKLANLQKRIKQHRDSMTNSCSEELTFYDAEIEPLITQINYLSRRNEDGHFWTDLFARNLLWHVKENIAASSMAISLLKIVLSKVPELKDHWKTLTENKEIGKINEMTLTIIHFDSQARDVTSKVAASEWFSTINSYLSLIHELENDLTLELARDVDNQRMEHSNHFWTVLCGILTAVIFCLAMTTTHGFQSHVLMKKVRHFTIRMAEKNAKIKEEKQKTEQLLVQMLPVSVAMKLLNGESVQPETYTEATVFFSDVKRFTQLCSLSSPLQVVTLLNDLYVMFDNILDGYDCYKVETIGDGYMVVSGVPERNGHQHSSEICSMALDFMKSTSDFVIPHMPQKTLHLRIGLHTGPCASGVIGVKMPRFCLFGDTVNVAARMESNGIADRIQITVDTKRHLDLHHGHFLFALRTEIDVKGKGKLKTYWLLGKENYNFRMEIPDVE